MSTKKYILAILMVLFIPFCSHAQRVTTTIQKQIENIVAENYHFPQFTVNTEAKKEAYYLDDNLQWQKAEGIYLVVTIQWYSTTPFYKDFTEYTCKFQKGNIQITIDMTSDQYMYIHNYFHVDKENCHHKSENMGGEWKPIGKDDIGSIVRKIKDLYTKRR